MAATKYFRFPFGSAGDVLPVPDTEPGDGSISYESGFGPDYALDLNTEPDALPVPRPQTNQLMKDITEGIQQYQQIGVPNFITSADNGGVAYPYEKYSRCIYDLGTGDGPQIWGSLINANNTTPGGANWRNLSTQAIQWAADFTYQIGDTVVYLGVLFYSLGNNNTGNIPAAPSIFWKSIFDDTNLSGVPTAPTAPIGTSTTQIATTAFVAANSSPFAYHAYQTSYGAGIPTIPDDGSSAYGPTLNYTPRSNTGTVVIEFNGYITCVAGGATPDLGTYQASSTINFVTGGPQEGGSAQFYESRSPTTTVFTMPIYTRAIVISTGVTISFRIQAQSTNSPGVSAFCNLPYVTINEYEI